MDSTERKTAKFSHVLSVRHLLQQPVTSRLNGSSTGTKTSGGSYSVNVVVFHTFRKTIKKTKPYKQIGRTTLQTNPQGDIVTAKKMPLNNSKDKVLHE